MEKHHRVGVCFCFGRDRKDWYAWVPHVQIMFNFTKNLISFRCLEQQGHV
jgi:hypothetical protein